MTLTKEYRKEILEKEAKKEFRNFLKLMITCFRWFLIIMLSYLIYLTIKYTVLGFLYGFHGSV